MDDTVLALTVNGGAVYAGGSFRTAGGVSANYVAQWNGSGWSALGAGAEYIVHALMFKGTDLYAGGLFGSDRWNGTSWSYTGGGGGSFAASGADFISAGVRWNGLRWSYLGGETNGLVYAVALIPDGAGGNALYAGGTFTIAGGKASSHFARWDGPAFNFSKSSIDFGQVHVGTTSTDSIIVTNSGSHTLEITSVTPFSYGTEYSVTPTSASLPLNASQKFYVTYTPTSAGLKKDIISFYENVSVSGNWLNVSGTGGAPVFTMESGGKYLGFVPPHTVKHDTEIVKNTGTEILTISSVSTSTPELTINPTSGSLAPSDSEIFYITFSPSGWYNDRTDTVTFAHNAAGSPTRFLCAAEATVFFIDTVDAGWNMLSVPIIVGDSSETALYSTATSRAFSYKGGYRPQDTLNFGSGYWVKFGSGTVVNYGGAVVDPETIYVSPGWNMIGSMYLPVSVSGITSNPPGMITSSFFGYSQGYLVASSLEPGAGYWVKVNQPGSLILSSSASTSANKIRIVSTDQLPPPPPSGVIAGSRVANLPKDFALDQNYPNPFNPSTIIRYQLPFHSYVILKIYNLLGEELKTLIDGVQDPGFKSAEWNAEDVPSGIYYYRLQAIPQSDAGQAGPFTQTRKFMLLK
jgi:hypothetical protein